MTSSPSPSSHRAAPLAATPRAYFIDRLRVVLTALVIAHHSAITYGASGGWFYRELTDGGTPSSLLLTVFCAVNQAFFMGMFFLIAGYYTPQSVARKGVRQFAWDRLLRLGLPLLCFGFVLGPLAVAVSMTASGVPGSGDWLANWWAQMRTGRFVIGPLWFAWALLLFAGGYLVWLGLAPRAAGDGERPVPRSMAWLWAALAVGAAAIAVRQVVPVGKNVWGLQLGYFASYVLLFATGCVGARHRWLERIERAQAVRWAWVALCTAPLLAAAVAVSGAVSGKPVPVDTGFGLAAVVYAFWEPFVAWGLIAGLLVAFRSRLNAPSAAWQAWGHQAYGAFVVHAPVVVAVSVSLADWAAPPLVKFAVLASVGTAVSFLAAAALLRLPGIRRIL